jgi:phosphate transport system substrate-binding protein
MTAKNISIFKKMFQMFLFSVSFSVPVWSANIIIGGTGNALGTMQIMADAYQLTHPDVTIKVLPSIGSSGAIKAIPKGKIDIGLSSRPLKEKESALGAIAIEYARTPTVIAMANHSPNTDITTDELVNIYSGKLTQWKNGELIRPVTRQANDDNTKQMERLSPALKEAMQKIDEHSKFLFASTDQEAVDLIEKTKGSFGVTTLALILSENRSIHALKLNGILPTPEACISGEYPIIKSFYFILPEEQLPLHVKDFLDFVESEQGIAILENNGNYPV